MISSTNLGFFLGACVVLSIIFVLVGVLVIAPSLEGDKGPTGDKGVDGLQGNQGPRGTRGTVIGAKGPDGLEGPQGALGDKGRDAPWGYTGFTGNTGTIGLNYITTYHVESETVLTVDPGSDTTPLDYVEFYSIFNEHDVYSIDSVNTDRITVPTGRYLVDINLSVASESNIKYSTLTLNLLNPALAVLGTVDIEIPPTYLSESRRFSLPCIEMDASGAPAYITLQIENTTALEVGEVATDFTLTIDYVELKFIGHDF